MFQWLQQKKTFNEITKGVECGRRNWKLQSQWDDYDMNMNMKTCELRTVWWHEAHNINSSLNSHISTEINSTLKSVPSFSSSVLFRLCSECLCFMIITIANLEISSLPHPRNFYMFFMKYLYTKHSHKFHFSRSLEASFIHSFSHFSCWHRKKSFSRENLRHRVYDNNCHFIFSQPLFAFLFTHAECLSPSSTLNKAKAGNIRCVEICCRSVYLTDFLSSRRHNIWFECGRVDSQQHAIKATQCFWIIFISWIQIVV